MTEKTTIEPDCWEADGNTGRVMRNEGVRIFRVRGSVRADVVKFQTKSDLGFSIDKRQM